MESYDASFISFNVITGSVLTNGELMMEKTTVEIILMKCLLT